MKRMMLLAVLVVSSMLLSCAARQPAAANNDIETLKQAIASYNSGMELYYKSVEQMKEHRRDYEKAQDAFNRELTNEQIDAQRNWLKYRNNESGARYLDTLTPEQYRVALILDDMTRSQEEYSKHIANRKLQLDEDKARIDQYAAALLRGAHIEAQRDAIITDGLLRLGEQSQRVGDGMMQRSRDLLRR